MISPRPGTLARDAGVVDEYRVAERMAEEAQLLRALGDKLHARVHAPNPKGLKWIHCGIELPDSLRGDADVIARFCDEASKYGGWSLAAVGNGRFLIFRTMAGGR